ncbi:hypothetical protein ZWY2020_016766 [Hordeum vulgare]|nr:hypothetical protein ZWY2020_016766 [Hordeum vulgare]
MSEATGGAISQATGERIRRASTDEEIQEIQPRRCGEVDRCSGGFDNAEGSKDTGPNSYPKQTTNPQQNQPNLGAGNGPSNSAMHKDLRFGAFEPTSALAKIGSRAASFEPSLTRFLGKTPKTYKGSKQSKLALKPLSLEEYFVGAKATSTTLPTGHGAPDTSTGAGPVSPTCQPQVDDLSQLMLLHADEASALLGHATTLARTEDAEPTGHLKLCSVAPADVQPASDSCLGEATADGLGHGEAAAAACGGALASAGGAQAGSTACAAQPHDGEAQGTYLHAHATTLAMHEDATTGGGYVSTAPRHIGAILPAPTAAQAACVDALAIAGEP